MKAYVDAAGAVGAAVARVGPGRWAGPGLGEWHLRTLVGHTGLALTNVLTYLDRPAPVEEIDSAEGYYTLRPDQTGEGADAAAVSTRARETGARLGDDPGAAFGELVARAAARIRAADPDQLVRTVAGGIRLESYVATRTVELVVHGYDIAAAAGVPVGFAPPTLAETAAVLARTAVRRGGGVDVIAALSGRADLPPGFSAV